MPNLSRRSFIAATLAAGTLRAVPVALTKAPARRVVTLVYDKALGAVRLIDRAVP
jgi:hypothetical protein